MSRCEAWARTPGLPVSFLPGPVDIVSQVNGLLTDSIAGHLFLRLTGHREML